MKTKKKNTWNAIKKSFAKAAQATVLVATLAGVARCGTEQKIQFEIPAKSPETTEVLKTEDSGSGMSRLTDVDRMLDSAMGNKPAFVCNEKNEVVPAKLEFPLVENEQPEAFDGAQIKESQCLRIDGAEKTYSVFLVKSLSQSNDREYTILVSEGGNSADQILLSHGKYYRIGNGISLFFVYDKSRDLDYVLVHKYSGQSKVDFKFRNFEETGTDDGCLDFQNGTVKMAEALKKITGINLEECYKTIKYYFDPGFSAAGAMANSSYMGDIGLANISPGYLLVFDKCARKYELHELMHIARFCANSSLSNEMNHVFWLATEEQIFLEYGNMNAVNMSVFELKKLVDSISANPSKLSALSPSKRCSAIRDYIMSKYYLSLDESGKKDLVKAFHVGMMKSDKMLAESREDKAQVDLVCSLVKEPGCMEMLEDCIE